MTSQTLIEGPIGIFDSGYGGLTVFKEIEQQLPDHDFIYLGDNARTPYGTRDFDTIYAYTWQCVQALFDQGCHLIILACNTASARALRNIQQLKLPQGPKHRRVLGVIRPTTEVIGNYTSTGQIGILATQGTVASETYPIEIKKFFPAVNVSQMACPMWVPLVESGEHEEEGANYFVKKYIDRLFDKSPNIDTLLLACTHYPILLDKIENATPRDLRIISQGKLVAESLKEYLARHKNLNELCSKNGRRNFLTTGSTKDFEEKALGFLQKKITAKKIKLA